MYWTLYTVAVDVLAILWGVMFVVVTAIKPVVVTGVEQLVVQGAEFVVMVGMVVTDSVVAIVDRVVMMGVE